MDMREKVKQRYGSLAKSENSCCCGSDFENPAQLGYGQEAIGSVEAASLMSLGCGNPLGLGTIEPGDVVLDVGSGGGFDCFLAARETGPGGQVIGVDMTPEMIEKAQSNAEKVGFTNVEFRQGFMEELPVESATVDLVISNCVVNLSQSKQQVFDEMYRVLKSGGQLAITDIVALGPLPQALLEDEEAFSACISGAAGVDGIEEMLMNARFQDITIQMIDEHWAESQSCCGGDQAALPVASAAIMARKD